MDNVCPCFYTVPRRKTKCNLLHIVLNRSKVNFTGPTTSTQIRPVVGIPFLAPYFHKFSAVVQIFGQNLVLI